MIFCFAVANYFAFSASFTLISLGFLLFLLAKSGYSTSYQIIRISNRHSIVNVKTDFVLNVYAAPGACREAADFHSRPFASAGGGYSKRHIFLSFTITPRLCHFQRHKSGNEKEKKSGNTRKPLVFFIFM